MDKYNQMENIPQYCGDRQKTSVRFPDYNK